MRQSSDEEQCPPTVSHDHAASRLVKRVTVELQFKNSLALTAGGTPCSPVMRGPKDEF